MSDELITGLPATLALRAEELARQHHAPRRRRWRFGLAGLASAVLVTSGAYAALGLWQPDLGTTSTSSKVRPVASAEPPQEQLVRYLAPLRREQTEIDRGNLARAALKYPANRYRILTNSVRQFGALPGGGTVILIPMISQTDGRHQLCMAIEGNPDARGRACTSAQDFFDGGLVIGTGDPPDPALESKLAALRREAGAKRDAQVERWLREHPGKSLQDLPMPLRSVTTQIPPELMGNPELHVVGLVPDGVAKVRLGTAGRVVPVRDNLFAFTAPERELGTLTATFLNEDGRPLPPLVAPEPATPPTAEDLQRLEEAFARGVSPKLKGRVEEISDGLVSACEANRARPRRSDQDIQAATASALRPLTGPLTERQVVVAAEIIRGVWCGRSPR